MPTLTDVIDGFVAGDDLDLTVTVTSVPAGSVLSRAWLTVKSEYGEADPGIFQKEVTSSQVSGQGQITDTGADGTGAVRFEITDTDTALIGDGMPYFYDVQVLTDTGKLYTPLRGKIMATQGVTGDTS